MNIINMFHMFTVLLLKLLQLKPKKLIFKKNKTSL